MMDQLTASIGHIRDGRIKALAISSKTRSPLLPNVPTLDESGGEGVRSEYIHRNLCPCGDSSGRPGETLFLVKESPAG
jgi:tripartite-type tricarboxylate transporter receptor subunit TctC